MAGNPLSSGSLAAFMASSLPSSSSSPSRSTSCTLNTPYDAIALLIHSAFIAIGFTLVGLGEDHRLPTPSSASSPHPLPSDWNSSSSTSSPNFAFRYTHPQSSMQYLLKVSRLGSKAVVFGLAIGDEKTTSFDLVVNDYLSTSRFPFSAPAASSDTSHSNISRPSDDDDSDNTEYLAALAESITRLFLTPGRLADLGALLKIHIIQKLMPGIHKLAYDPSMSSAAAAPSSSERVQNARIPTPSGMPQPHNPYEPARPYPFEDPLAAGPPERPFPAGEFAPPGFDDEHDLLRRPGYGPGSGLGAGGRNPLSIGHDDLYPPGMGPDDGLRGVMRPGGGLGGMGGMHPTFDDPLFRGEGGRRFPNDPRVPPGARYDPTGPGDGPHFGSGGLGPRFPGGRGGPPGGFGGGMGGFGGGDII